MKKKLEEIRQNKNGDEKLLFNEIRYYLTMEQHYIVADDAEMLPEIKSIANYLSDMLLSSVVDDMNFAIVAIVNLIEFVGEIVLKKSHLHPTIIRCTASSDPAIARNAARLLPYMVLNGFTTSDTLEEELKMRIKSLSDENIENRYLSILIVRELAYGSPHTFYQYIQPFFEHIFTCFKDSRYKTQIVAADTVRSLLTILAQRELFQKSAFNWYEFIYEKALRLLPSKENSTRHSSVSQNKNLARENEDSDHFAHAVLLLLNEFVRQCSLDLEIHRSNLIQIFPIRMNASSVFCDRQRKDLDDYLVDQYEMDRTFEQDERLFSKRSKNTLLHRYFGSMSPELEKYRLFLEYTDDHENLLGNLFGGGPSHDILRWKITESSSVVGCYSQTLSIMIQHNFEDILKFCFVSLADDNVHILIAVCHMIPNIINVKLSLFKHTVTQNIILRLINIFPTSPARPYILLCFTLLGRLLKEEFLFQAKNILGYIKSLYTGGSKGTTKRKVVEMEAPIACFICSMIQSIGQPFIESISMDFVEACINNMVFDFSVAAIFSELTTCPSKSKSIYQSTILQYIRSLLGFNIDSDTLIFGGKHTSNVVNRHLLFAHHSDVFNTNDNENDDKVIITALIALRMCEFGAEYMDEITIKVANTYLTSPSSAIREEAAKTCIKLLDNAIGDDNLSVSATLNGNEDDGDGSDKIISSYLFTKGSCVFNQDENFSISQCCYVSDIYALEILSVIAGIGITDIDERTRLSVLRSFTPKFYPYLLLMQNIQCLVIGLRDKKYEIRCVVANLLGKLCSIQPSYVFPVLTKYLVETLSYLQPNCLIIDEGIREKSTVLLNTLIVSSPRLAHESIQSIVDVIFPVFDDSTASTSLVCNVMNVIGDLITTCDKTMHKFLPNVIVIIINILSDPFSSYYKRVASLDVMSHILNSSGYVLHHFYSIHKMVDILITYIKIEKSKINRCKAINVLGLIGAVNPTKMKVYYSTSEFIRQLDSDEGGFDCFHNDINSSTILSTDNEVNTCEFYINNNIQSLDQLYPLAGIEALLMVLSDPTMTRLHSVVLHELERILIFLGKNSVQYAKKIFEAYFHIVKIGNNDIRLIVLQQINKLTSLVGCQLHTHLDEMFQMLDDLWVDNCTLSIQVTIIQLVDNLVNSLPYETKMYSKLILSKMSRILNNELDHSCFTNDEINILKTKTITTLQRIVPFMSEFLHLIIPILISIYDSTDNLIPLRRLGMETIDIIASNASLCEFASPIMQSLIQVLNTCPELQQTSCALISTMASHLGSVFKSYAPTIDIIMAKYRIKSIKYDTSLNMIEVGSYTHSINGYNQKFNGLEKKAMRRQLSSTLDSVVCRNKPRLDMLRLKWAWITSNKSSKEDFINWFKKLCTEFLLNSPSFVLRSCSAICFEYAPITKNLFNCSFASIWCELSHELKTNLFHSIADALNRDYIPEIISILLNLIEFTNYVELDFCIDEDIIAKSASSVNSYTTALFFIERKFKKTPNKMDILQSIISLNMKLQNMDAAIGVLKYAESHSKNHIGIPEEWYEELHDYEGALNGYDQKLKENSKNKFFLHKKMKCLESLGRWNELCSLLKSPDIYESAHSTSIDSSTDGITSNIFIAKIGASTCLGLSNFSMLEKEYLPRIPHDSFLGYFYSSVVKIYHKEYTAAQSLISHARDLLDSELSGILGDTYDHYYDALVFSQLLTELDEVIDFELVPSRRDKIKLNWQSRIERCKPVVENWEKILNLRSIVIPPLENVDSWLKFASLARKSGRIDLASRIFYDMLKIHESQMTKLLKPTRIPVFQPNILYNFIKFLWHTKSQTLAHQYMENFIKYLVPQVDCMKESMTISNFTNDVSSAKHLVSKCYLHLARWKLKLDGDQFNLDNITAISNLYNCSILHDKNWVKSVHSQAIMNYEVVLFYKREVISSKNCVNKTISSDDGKINLSQMDVAEKYAAPAINGFFDTLKMVQDFALQDILRIITLWFDFGQYSCVNDSVKKNAGSIKIDYWLKVIPQLIARINIPKQNVALLIRELLIDIGKNHPQSLIYPIAVASNRALETNQMGNIRPIIISLQEHSNALMGQAMLVSHELIRLSVSWVELSLRILEEIFFAFNYDKSIAKILYVVSKFQKTIESKPPETIKECLFMQCYQKNLVDLKRLAERYRATNDESCITGIWTVANDMHTRLNKEVQCLTRIDLCTSSPKLLACNHMELAVPSTYEPNKPIIRIEQVFPRISVMKSKQRPRKLIIIGSNGEEFTFLLKGNEDLRQDERVMQLFKLINSLLTKDNEALQRELFVTRYAVIPLSVNSGLIGWVPNCDTLNSLIVERRNNRRISLNTEKNALTNICPYYQFISVVHKMHAFERALLTTDGEDIAESLYRKSPSCDVWFHRRRVYTRSLAAMSIVGYILGLGDRHLSNMMMDKNTGRIVHIDFGDCFEVCMTRSSFPEKVPFRLTRVLVKALEVTGINGSFRITCDHVMRVLRNNKESVFAVLEAFIYDPLISWRLFEVDKKWADTTFTDSKMNLPGSFPPDPSSLVNNLSSVNYNVANNNEETFSDDENINKKGLQIICRIRDKLSGKDFNNAESITVNQQTFLLINQATSIENLCEAYVGWAPLI